jgi:hypothetical protein
VQWLLLVKLASKGKRLMLVKLLNMPLLLFVQLASKEQTAPVCAAFVRTATWSLVRLLLVELLKIPLLLPAQLSLLV